MNRLSEDPYIKIVYKRTFKIHVKSLMAVVKDKHQLKLYCLYLNLHSRYKQKVFLNYKENYADIKKQTGLPIYQLKKYIQYFIDEGICFSIDSKHLHIGSPHKFMKWLGIAWDYLAEDSDYEFMKFADKVDENPDSYSDFIYNIVQNEKKLHKRATFKHYHSKFITIKKKERVTIYELQSLSLELLRKQKRRGFLLKSHGSKYELRRNIRKLGIIEISTKLETQCATDSTAESYLHLCLSEIARHFGLETKQGASKRMALLESKRFIKSTKVFKYLGKVDTVKPAMVNKKNTFIKNGWIIEQMPNNTTFLRPVTPLVWWDKVINNYFQQIEKTKSEKRKLRKTKSVVSVSSTLQHYLNRPLIYGKKLFKESFVNRLTGEIEHISIYYVFRDLSIKGKKFLTHYVTNFKKLNLKSYIKIREKISVLEV